jgi:hypothetical protein
MISKIIIFISLITYILTAVTVSSVETGTCTNKKYTFVIKAKSDANITAGSATVALASPENTTPTCTYGAVTDATSSRRRLADGAFDITCEITSKLDNVQIKVQSVTIGGAAASAASGATLPLTMSANATCEGTTTTTTTNTTNTDSTTTDAGKFIQISGFLFLFILTIF